MWVWRDAVYKSAMMYSIPGNINLAFTKWCVFTLWTSNLQLHISNLWYLYAMLLQQSCGSQDQYSNMPRTIPCLRFKPDKLIKIRPLFSLCLLLERVISVVTHCSHFKPDCNLYSELLISWTVSLLTCRPNAIKQFECHSELQLRVSLRVWITNSHRLSPYDLCISCNFIDFFVLAQIRALPTFQNEKVCLVR